MKKLTYKKRGNAQGNYLILVNDEEVASVKRVKATRPEEWDAWESGHLARPCVFGARTRAIATKAILALLEIGVEL